MLSSLALTWQGVERGAIVVVQRKEVILIGTADLAIPNAEVTHLSLSPLS